MRAILVGMFLLIRRFFNKPDAAPDTAIIFFISIVAALISIFGTMGILVPSLRINLRSVVFSWPSLILAAFLWWSSLNWFAHWIRRWAHGVQDTPANRRPGVWFLVIMTTLAAMVFVGAVVDAMSSERFHWS